MGLKELAIGGVACTVLAVGFYNARHAPPERSDLAYVEREQVFEQYAARIPLLAHALTYPERDPRREEAQKYKRLCMDGPVALDELLSHRAAGKILLRCGWFNTEAAMREYMDRWRAE